MSQRRVIYNDDGQGVNEARPESAEADLRTWVDKPLTQIPVDTYAWCTAYPDIVLHNSKVGEIYGQRFDAPPNRSAAAMRELHKAGTDAIQIVADQVHRHDVEMVASIRMNDTHHRHPDPNTTTLQRCGLEL